MQFLRVIEFVAHSPADKKEYVRNVSGDDEMVKWVAEQLLEVNILVKVEAFENGKLICCVEKKNTLQMIDLCVDLYKPSGKWAYNCNCTVGIPHGYIETETLLDLIAKAQNQVSPAAITEGRYIVVIKETDEQLEKPEYENFLTRLIMHKQ